MRYHGKFAGKDPHLPPNPHETKFAYSVCHARSREQHTARKTCGRTQTQGGTRHLPCPPQKCGLVIQTI